MKKVTDAISRQLTAHQALTTPHVMRVMMTSPVACVMPNTTAHHIRNGIV